MVALGNEFRHESKIDKKGGKYKVLCKYKVVILFLGLIFLSVPSFSYLARPQCSLIRYGALKGV